MLAVAMWSAIAAASPQALVIPIQSVEVDDADVKRLTAAMSAEVVGHQWTAVDVAATERLLKSASMCGEDADCLATLGQRVGAQWVLAFSIGKLSKGYLVSTMWVEVATGKRKSGTTEKMASIPVDFTNLARALVDPLFRDVPSAVVLTPGPPPEVPPMVVAETGRPVRGAAIGLLAGGGAAGVVGVILSVMAGNSYAALASTPAEQRPAADLSQRNLNIAADVVVGVAIAGVATGLVLLLADAASSSPPPTQEASP